MDGECVWMTDFTHLHVHSEYSLLDGAARIKDLVAQAALLGMNALALTDHGVMYGAVEFYKACKEQGIKPIIGCEVYFTRGSRKEKGNRKDQPIYHLILLARNMQGYRNLMQIVSIGHLEGYHYKPRVDEETLRAYAEGIIALSACLGGEVSQHLLHDRDEEAKEAAVRYRDIFGTDFYLELQDHGLLEQKKVNAKMIQLSQETGIPLVVTNDVHYVHEQDSALQEVLICIGTGKTLEDEDRLQFDTTQMYLKSAEEMASLFPHAQEAIVNTMRIAERCELELELGLTVLPAFNPIPSGHSAESYLKELCHSGLEQRYRSSPQWMQASFREKVSKRLAYELQVISNMGFSDYFLIVWDFIRFAKKKGIAVGPGRGSSAGSLVAYVLQITEVDPIKYGLLFERFLNPERVSMPDIDVDFSDERRDEVIAYVVSKYGASHVAQIITFGTMAAKAAVRDVGRVMNLPYHVVDRTAKLIPGHVGISLDEAIRMQNQLREQIAHNSHIHELMEIARKVEGFPRHASTHAAGVVISREPLTHYTPLQQGSEQTVLTQYSMNHLESIGLLKMDFLGLRTLSIIERAIGWIKKRTGETIDFHMIPDDDKETYEMLSRGDTAGVFQMESPGMRRVLKELRPSEFEDIISVNALYRPGPMEFIPKYIQGKHGDIKVEYPHPKLEPILRDTYGIIVYQEQIMQIASTMAGFSLGEADLLRRAVSKKKREVLNEQRVRFVQGCIRLGYTDEEANRVYDMIVRFADYGFPRAHATAYGVLAYQTAYLKCHYPSDFMASMLTSVMGNHKKVAEYVDTCRRMGIAVLPPDVNESDATFTPVSIETEDGKKEAIRFGLAAIKHVGAQAIESIQKLRTEHPFESLMDFCQRIDLRVCNKRVIESLILAGALDSLPGHRAQKISILDETLEVSAKWKKEKEDLQLHLFGFTEQLNVTVDLPDVSPYPAARQLEMEREMLGLYLSGHPLDPFESDLEPFDLVPLHLLGECDEGSWVNVAGLVISCRPIMTRKGKAMAFMEIEDRIDQVEVVLFPPIWSQFGSLVKQGNVLLVRGRVQHDEPKESVKLIAEQLYAVDRLPEKLESSVRHSQRIEQKPPRSKQRLYIKISADKEQAQKLKALKRLLEAHKGPLSVVLYYERTHKSIALSDELMIKPSPALVEKIERLLGKGTVRIR